ncbi:hypothetical protein VB773_16810 [Haloarculaceae archaeon H-GB2-1]|nr:hypothetical protein [Haloarculaceae archaeon H-GB1-1]MEA5387582.1 hypothetical protein [Haloarculaceae archaeon H-GB11]MEA5409066.1 hypothetical protein [Haloarculaceae archaeon H-GB2-1]
MALWSVLGFGVVASSALVVGSLLGAFWKPPEWVVAAALALSSGSLITALAFELFEPAFRIGGGVLASSGLFLGAGVFTATKWVLETVYQGEDSGPALLANVTLDGVPENVALGIVLIGNQGSRSGLTILVAIVLSNLPEAIGGAKKMQDAGFSRLGAVGAWTSVGVLLAVAVIAGNLLFADLGSAAVAAARSFAGGAVLAGVAIEILPDAYEEGGPLVAMATAVGFVVTFLVR